MKKLLVGVIIAFILIVGCQQSQKSDENMDFVEPSPSKEVILTNLVANIY